MVIPSSMSSWPSPSTQFAFGFYPQGNDFMVGIWLVDIDNNITVVWTANRDDPPVTSNATLKLTKSGKLLLKTDEQGKKKPITTSLLLLPACLILAILLSTTKMIPSFGKLSDIQLILFSVVNCSLVHRRSTTQLDGIV